MFGFADRQFSIAVRPPSMAPWVGRWQAMVYEPPPVYVPVLASWPFSVALPGLMPMPWRKPWSRSMSTETTWLLNRSSIAMTAGLPPRAAAAYWPSSLPAWVLSVAKVMSAVLAGLGAVSSAMTKRPACLAWLSAVLTASPLVVIRMPLSPREMALSIALICVWVSPSVVPAATVRLTLSLAAWVLAS